MIAVIGLMVGFYIITKMLDILSTKAKNEHAGITVIMACVTILVTIGAMLYFLFGPDLMKGMIGLK